MKTKILLLILTVFSTGVFAQKFSGKAVYHVHTKSMIKIGGVNEAQRKKMEEQLKKMGHKIFNLDFNGKESLYEKQAKLETPDYKSDMKIKIISNNYSENILYKNIANKEFSYKKNFMGKTFLIQDSLKNNDWKLSNETKMIGKYNCFKATISKTVNSRKFDQKTNTFKDTIKTINTTAWYTPDIPVGHGPEQYWGLPGLILELKKGNKTIVCSEVNLQKGKSIEIEKPKKGKNISQKKFDELKYKKTEELMKRYNNNRQTNHNNLIYINTTN